MGVPAEQPGTLKQSIFTQDITGQQVHCQIVHLGKQVYVWLGTAGGSPQGGLYAAVPFKGELTPAVTVLQQGRNDEDGREAVQRIAHKAACPIVLSYNIPSHPVEFKVALLRRVLAEVTSML